MNNDIHLTMIDWRGVEIHPRFVSKIGHLILVKKYRLSEILIIIILRGFFGTISRTDGVEMISGVVLGLFIAILKLDNRLSRSSWWFLFAVCPENILHGRKTRDMLLLAHFVGDGVSVTRLVCRLVCKISGGIRFSGKKRSCMVTFQANVRAHV